MSSTNSIGRALASDDLAEVYRRRLRILPWWAVRRRRKARAWLDEAERRIVVAVGTARRELEVEREIRGE